MKNKVTFILASVGLVTAFCFNNCSRTSSKLSSSEQASTAPVETLDTGREEPQFDEKLLTGDQILASFAAITKVSPTQSRVANEFRSKASLLSDNFNLSSVTSPMMIGVANLAGEFCNQAVATESPKLDAERRLFKGVDFTKAISTMTDANYQLFINEMSRQMWLRDLSEDEYLYFEVARKEFIANLKTPADSRDRTKELAIFICTAMLSSYETITF